MTPENSSDNAGNGISMFRGLHRYLTMQTLFHYCALVPWEFWHGIGSIFKTKNQINNQIIT